METRTQSGAGMPPDEDGFGGLVKNPCRDGSFVLVCDHATFFIPDEFENLGLTQPALNSHIAWDPGALAVASVMAEILNAPLVAPLASRLVCDCNRSPDRDDAVPARSEAHDIPGNLNLSAAQRQDRIDRFHTPFHDAVAGVVGQAIAEGRPPVLVSLHSFSPVYLGEQREMHLGVIHDTDRRFADAFLRATSASSLNVQRNRPYSPQDGVTHTLVRHSADQGLLNLMIEVRNDLIVGPTEQAVMGEMLSDYLLAAHRSLRSDSLAPGGSDGPFSHTDPQARQTESA